MDLFTKSNDIVKVFTNIKKDRRKDSRIKISIIGCGSLGGACVASLVYTNLNANIVLIEPIEKYYGREKSLFLGFSCASSYISSFKMSYSNDLIASIDSDICLICFDNAGDKNTHKTYREGSFHENILLFKKFIPPIVKLSPKVILIILTYPLSVLTLATHKIAKIPKHRIIGLGTSLSTSDFQIIIAKIFNVSPREVEGYIVGLNLSNQKIPLWSTVNICGIHLNTIVPCLGTDEDPLKLHHKIKKIELGREKMYEDFRSPSWAVALLCAKICNAITYNTKEVFTIPVNIKGLYDITKTCVISVPCTIGRNGIHSIINLQINLKEKEELRRVAAYSFAITKKLERKIEENYL